MSADEARVTIISCVHVAIELLWGLGHASCLDNTLHRFAWGTNLRKLLLIFSTLFSSALCLFSLSPSADYLISA